MDYYEENLYGEEYKEEYNEEPYNQKLCFKQKQEQTEAEALELTYSHLGRLVQSAEMLAYKLNLIKQGEPLKYQLYDSFNVAEMKNIDTLKYDVINFLDFYEKAIIIHNKKFKYVHPKSINILIQDLTIWKNKALKNDKRFFIAILDLIQKGSYDDSAFPDENVLYEKAKKDNSKFKKDAGFWKTFSVPILKFLSFITNSTKKKVKMNPNYKPDIHFGEKAKNNNNLLKTLEARKLEMKINENINEINIILLNKFQNNNDINLQSLVNVIEKLKILYCKFKKDYGEFSDIQLNPESLSTLKSFISKLKQKDINIYNMLNSITIEMDPDSMN